MGARVGMGTGGGRRWGWDGNRTGVEMAAVGPVTGTRWGWRWDHDGTGDGNAVGPVTGTSGRGARAGDGRGRGDSGVAGAAGRAQPPLPAAVLSRRRPQLLRIRQKEAKRRQSPVPAEGRYRRRAPPVPRCAGDALAPVSPCPGGAVPEAAGPR